MKPVIFERFASGISLADNGCWIWTRSRNEKGYGRLRWKPDRYAHRISWRIFRGHIPEGMDVCHHCDNPPCCNPEHLFLGDDTLNYQDSATKGRRVVSRGSQLPQSLLSEAAAKDIRNKYQAGGVTQQQLADAWAIHIMTVNDVLHRRSWRHV